MKNQEIVKRCELIEKIDERIECLRVIKENISSVNQEIIVLKKIKNLLNNFIAFKLGKFKVEDCIVIGGEEEKKEYYRLLNEAKKLKEKNEEFLAGKPEELKRAISEFREKPTLSKAIEESSINFERILKKIGKIKNLDKIKNFQKKFLRKINYRNEANILIIKQVDIQLSNLIYMSNKINAKSGIEK